MDFQVVGISPVFALAPIGKLPTIGKLTIEAKGFSGRG